MLKLSFAIEKSTFTSAREYPTYRPIPAFLDIYRQVRSRASPVSNNGPGDNTANCIGSCVASAKVFTLRPSMPLPDSKPDAMVLPLRLKFDHQRSEVDHKSIVIPGISSRLCSADQRMS